MKKNRTWIIVSIISILLIIIGVSYAYWSLTFEQTENNVVSTDCFEIEFMEENAINLSKVYPVSDEDGLKNIPYTFTIKNVCESSADYQINLETLIPNGKKLPDQYLKVDLKSDNKSIVIDKLDKELNPNFETEPTIENAVDAYILFIGTLSPKEEKTFELRIWMHSDVTATDKDSMNAEYNGRITVITSYTLTTLADTLKLLPKVTEGTGLYEVSHSDAKITYTSDETAINNLSLTELRYAGANPDNYVNFNNELWRVIGLVNTPEGQRIKLIRNESIGNYSWDSSESSVNSGLGINEWSTSAMMELLNNGAYYNRTSSICFNGRYNATTECDFSETGLMNDTKNMIDTITWNLGSNDEITYTYTNINTHNFYNLERSNNTGNICNSGSWCTDTVPRTTTWIGKVGLMYPSDFGYATSGGVTTDRATCLNTVLYFWNENNISDCTSNDWLYNSINLQWTITPYATSGNSNNVFRVPEVVNVGYNSASYSDTLRPSIYLKTNVKITSGNGSVDSPFELSV